MQGNERERESSVCVCERENRESERARRAIKKSERKERVLLLDNISVYHTRLLIIRTPSLIKLMIVKRSIL